MPKQFVGVCARVMLILALAAQAGLAATRLEIAYVPILPMAQLFVISGEGWAIAAGLELDLTEFSSGPAITQALEAGRFDAAYIGIGPAIIARAEGVDIKVVAANGMAQVALIARAPLAAAFAQTRTPAEALALFRRQAGHAPRIVTLPSGSVPDTVLRYWLKTSVRAPNSSVEILGVGEERARQLLLAGIADAGALNEPILTIIADHDPGARIIVTGGEMFAGQPGAVLAVRARVIAAHEQAIESLVALHIRATRLIGSDPRRAAELIHAVIGKGSLDLDTVLRAMKSPVNQPISDPHRILAATNRMAEFQRSLGLIEKPVPVDELFDLHLYDAAVKNE